MAALSIQEGEVGEGSTVAGKADRLVGAGPAGKSAYILKYHS